mmetsp:Transcript_35220/g.41108  ORF Transcript_35220/g.41108 Transcript_35220/m.41108 type:complete len:185 (-) Transcript_35220:188-742(-)
MQILKKSASFLNKELFTLNKRFIAVGEKFSSKSVKVVSFKNGDYEVSDAKTDELLKGKKVVVVGFPGAFTPVCATQLKEFIEDAGSCKKKGVDEIYALAVNDPFVMKEYAKFKGSKDNIKWIADGNGELVKALDLAIDLGKGFLGTRSRRCSMIVKDGKVEELNDEKSTDMTDISRVSTILKQL